MLNTSKLESQPLILASVWSSHWRIIFETWRFYESFYYVSQTTLSCFESSKRNSLQVIQLKC